MNNVIGTWSFDTAAELVSALEAALDAAKDEGHRSDTVYLNKRHFSLVRETLTDGSHVVNVRFSEAS